MAKIEIKDLTFSYDGNDLITALSISIDSEWKSGLIGKNGQGKTTLFKLLTRQIKEYSGTINTQLNLAMFPFAVDESDLVFNIIQDLVYDVEYWQIVKEFNQLALAEVIIYQPYQNLSGGQKVKVMLVALFLQQNIYVLLDEPTNHLDSVGKQVVIEYLKKQKGYLVISHDRLFLNECTDHILALSKGEITVYKGNYDSYALAKDKILQNELKTNERLEKQIKDLEKASKEAKRWSNSKEKEKTSGKNSAGIKPDKGALGAQAARLMQKSKNFENRIERNLEQKKQLLQDVDYIPTLKLEADKVNHQQLLIVDKLSYQYSDNLVLNQTSFTLSTSDKLVIKGVNGSGKTTLIKLLTNELNNYQGLIKKAKRLNIFKVEQESEYLSGSYTDLIKEYNLDEAKFYALLRKLDFERVLFNQKLDSLSSGQKKKVLIAVSLLVEADIIIWDEVLNYLDLSARVQLENLLVNSNKTMILIDHDQYFLDKVATKELILQ